MNTEVLTLTQLLSPSFPVGAFAYSHGLETVIISGRINDASSLQDWLRDLLTDGGAQSDAVLLNAAFAGEELADETARAFAASAERLQETTLQGQAFCEAVNAVWNLKLSNLTYPVAVGRTACAMKLDVTLTTALYLHAFVSNLTGAAMRLVPLGQSDGQRVIAALSPLCEEIATSVQGATLADISNHTWLSDIAAMQHETLYSRTFRS